MKKEELFNKFKKCFQEQMGLDIEEVLEFKENTFVLKMELMAISMASMRLDLDKEEHGQMAEFLELIKEDNK